MQLPIVKGVVGCEKCYYQHQTSINARKMSKYGVISGPETNPYLDTIHAVMSHMRNKFNFQVHRSFTFPWQDKIY